MLKKNSKNIGKNLKKIEKKIKIKCIKNYKKKLLLNSR